MTAKPPDGDNNNGGGMFGPRSVNFWTVVGSIATALGLIVAVIALATQCSSSGSSSSTRPTNSPKSDLAPSTTFSSASPAESTIPTEPTQPPYKSAYSETTLILPKVPGPNGTTGSCGTGASIDISAPSVNTPSTDSTVSFQSACNMSQIGFEGVGGGGAASKEGADNPNSCVHATQVAPLGAGQKIAPGNSLCVVANSGGNVAYMKYVGLTSDGSAKFVVDGWTT